MPDEIKIAKLLGRPLSSIETDNFELYLNIVKDRLESLLGYDVARTGANTLLFNPRIGYNTLYVYPYTAITTITINGSEIEGYTKRRWDELNADWFNSVEFDSKMTDKRITINATWGFGAELPDDLAYLIARMFNALSQEQVTDGRVEQKSIEGYSIRYRDTSAYKQFVHDNQAVIAKYSIKVGEIQSGEVKNERLYQFF